MGIQTTSNLTNSLRAKYINDYMAGADQVRLYDQFASPPDGISMEDAIKSSAVYIPVLGDMTPGTTAISETVDITPQTLLDTNVNVTWTSLSEGLMASEKLLIEAYTPYGAQMFTKLGQNQMESVDLQARNAACAGDWVERAAAAATRATLNGSTSTHKMDDGDFLDMWALLQDRKVPGWWIDGNVNWICLTHPFVFADILEGGNIDTFKNYGTDSALVFNYEAGRMKVGPFRVISHADAKVFVGAGADRGTDTMSTTLSTASSALDLTITVASSAYASAGKFINVIDTVETGSTHVGTNERVKYSSVSSSVITFTGGRAANGGLRFGHAASIAVNNDYSVYTAIFGGPQSLVKLWAPSTGEYGEVVGPKKQGTADQWTTLAWKWLSNSHCTGRPVQQISNIGENLEMATPRHSEYVM